MDRSPAWKRKWRLSGYGLHDPRESQQSIHYRGATAGLSSIGTRQFARETQSGSDLDFARLDGSHGGPQEDLGGLDEAGKSFVFRDPLVKPVVDLLGDNRCFEVGKR